MVQDIVIRAEFLIKDLRKAMYNGEDFHSNIIKAWQEDIRYLISNGKDVDMVYDYKCKEDLKECIDMGLDAEDIAYLVSQHQVDKDKTQFFRYTNSVVFELHILSKAEVAKAISEQIEQIAYNTLKYPYKGVYAELYREFVVPMIEGQGY